MFTQNQTAVRHKIWISLGGLRYIPYWAAALISAAMLLKLAYLDKRLNIGGMNNWKWEVNAGAMLLATFWTAFVGPRTRMLALLIIDLLLSAVIFADLVYFRYFKDFISMPVLLQAGQVSSLQDSITSLMEFNDAVYFADVPFVILLAVLVFRAHRRGKTRLPGSRKFRLSVRFMTGIIAFVIGYQLISTAVAEQKNGWAHGLFDGNWWNIPIYNVTGLFGFHGYDAYRYAKENWLGGGLSDAEIKQAADWLAARKQLQRQAESDSLFGAYKGKNVLVVQAEAFQTFLLNRKIGDEEITPNLNKLIGKSAYFPNFYHQTATGRTSDADFATSCSLQPVSSGSVFIRFANHTFDCLPLILKSQGYGVTVHHVYDGSFWNRNNMYHNMQYDKFYNIKDFKIDEPLGWSLGDKSFFRQTVDQIEARDRQQPFYALAITLSSHHPYTIGYQGLNVGPLSGKLLGNYIQAAHYVDAAVGELVGRLQKDGLWDDTILMFYGDHDNSNTDWNDYAILFGRPVTELEKSTLIKQVPYLIHFPNDEHAGVHEKPAGQIDTSPTILHLLGIPSGGYSLMGVSAMSDAPKQVVFRNGGFTDGKVFFVPNNEGIAGHGTCYSAADGSVTDAAACRAGAEEAQLELQASDRIVEHDLIPLFREQAAGKK